MAKRRRRLARDPLAPTRPAVLQREARAAAKAQIDPIVAELTRSTNARAAAGSKNITGVTQALQNQLYGAEGRTAAIYQDSQRQLDAVNQQVQGQVSAAGQSGAAALAARLALGGQQQLGLGEKLAAEGQGATAATAAYGGNASAQLIQSGAASRNFAATLPGLAGLSGLQGVREMEARKQQELAEGVAEIRAKIPGLVSQLVESGRNREVDKAVAARTFGLNEAKFLEESRQFAVKEAGDARDARLNRRAKAAESAKDRAARMAIARENHAAALTLARTKWENSEKTAKDRRIFEDEQRSANNAFKAEQAAKNRKAYGSGGKKKGESKSGL